MTAPFGALDKIVIRVPRGLGSEIFRRAKEDGCSRAEYLRRVLCEAVDYVPEPRQVPEIKLPLVRCKPAPEAPKAVDLLARGYSATQIASILRMPYRRVLELIGQGVDDEVMGTP
jgi:hypothetical protein